MTFDGTDPRSRLIVALDVPSADDAARLVEKLARFAGYFKVGLELASSHGWAVARHLRDAGASRLFLDMKLHDIPSTVAGATRAVAPLAPWCITAHSLGGAEMLSAASNAAAEGAVEAGCPPAHILGVTVLTSLSAEDLKNDLKVDVPVERYVAHLTRLSARAGCAGVIASPHEVAFVREAVPDATFLVVTPGIRPTGVSDDDQRRAATPAAAIRAGATHLVVGRAITAAPAPAEAASRILDEIASAVA